MSAKPLPKWRSLTLVEWWLLGETAVLSLTIQLFLRTIPFRIIAKSLGKETENGASRKLNVEQKKRVAQVSWAVAAIGRRSRWRNQCLVDAIMAKWMLRWRGISSLLSIGVAKDAQRNLQAHAWLRADDFIVTGKNEHERFQPTVLFE